MSAVTVRVLQPRLLVSCACAYIRSYLVETANVLLQRVTTDARHNALWWLHITARTTQQTLLFTCSTAKQISHRSGGRSDVCWARGNPLSELQGPAELCQFIRGNKVQTASQTTAGRRRTVLALAHCMWSNRAAVLSVWAENCLDLQTEAPFCAGAQPFWYAV